MIHFTTENGLYADDAETVRTNIQEDVKRIFAPQGELNVTPASPAGQLIDIWAALAHQKDSEILFLGNMFDPQVAVGRWQQAIGAIYFLERKIATATVVTCTCRGLYGTVIPAGSIVQDASGVQYKSLGTVTIPLEQEIDVEFQCTETGPIEVAATKCNKIITTIPGWDSVVNDVAGVTGSNEETQSEFENRRYEAVANNAHGSVAAVKGALWKVDNVVDVVIQNNVGDDPITAVTAPKKWRGIDIAGHSIAISILGGDDDDIAETIYMKLNAGCGTSGNHDLEYYSEDGSLNEYKIERTSPVPIYVKVFIRTADTITTADIISKIEDAILADADGKDENSKNDMVHIGDRIYASRFSICVVRTAGAAGLVGINIGRNSNDNTLVTCTCTGAAGTTIPEGSIVRDTNYYEYKNAADVSIPASGSVDVEFECIRTGAVEVAAGAVTEIVTPVTGWTSVTNAAAGITGLGEFVQLYTYEHPVFSKDYIEVELVDG